MIKMMMEDKEMEIRATLNEVFWSLMTKEEYEEILEKEDGVFFLVTEKQRLHYEIIRDALKKNLEQLQEKREECQVLSKDPQEYFVPLGEDKLTGPQVTIGLFLSFLDESIRKQEELLDGTERMLEEYGAFTEEDNHLVNLYWNLSGMDPERKEDYGVHIPMDIDDNGTPTSITKRELIARQKGAIKEYIALHRDKLTLDEGEGED